MAGRHIDDNHAGRLGPRSRPLFARRRTHARFTATGLVRHSDDVWQYTSIAYTAALVEAGIVPPSGRSVMPWTTRS